jgi:hypothetical protein
VYNSIQNVQLGCAQNYNLQEYYVHLPKRICQNCGCEYWPIYPTQRWCNYICRNEYRNAELRAARELWKQSGKTLEMIAEGDAA